MWEIIIIIIISILYNKGVNGYFIVDGICMDEAVAESKQIPSKIKYFMPKSYTTFFATTGISNGIYWTIIRDLIKGS